MLCLSHFDKSQPENIVCDYLKNYKKISSSKYSSEWNEWATYLEWSIRHENTSVFQKLIKYLNENYTKDDIFYKCNIKKSFWMALEKKRYDYIEELANLANILDFDPYILQWCITRGDHLLCRILLPHIQKHLACHLILANMFLDSVRYGDLNLVMILIPYLHQKDEFLSSHYFYRILNESFGLSSEYGHLSIFQYLLKYMQEHNITENFHEISVKINGKQIYTEKNKQTFIYNQSLFRACLTNQIQMIDFMWEKSDPWVILQQEHNIQKTHGFLYLKELYKPWMVQQNLWKELQKENLLLENDAEKISKI